MQFGSDVINPSPKPATTQSILLPISFQNAPLSIIVLTEGTTLSAKGKLLPVVFPIESRYHTRNAAQRESSSQTLSSITNFFFFFVSSLILYLPFHSKETLRVYFLRPINKYGFYPQQGCPCPSLVWLFCDGSFIHR